MKAIIVDDESWMIEQFREECGELRDIEVAGTFTSALQALEYARENRVDVAFLDAQMPGMNGMQLAAELRKLYSDMVIVFVTAYPEYIRDMLDVRSDYILLKPYTAQQVQDVLERVRYLSKRIKKRIYIRTFGSFEVFADGVPMVFEGRRDKEILAFLTDRNGAVTDPASIFSAIWENREYSRITSSNYRKAMNNLERTLEKYDAGNIIIRNSSGACIVRDAVDCDYFDFLDRAPGYLTSFTGEYMTQYSWAEETLGRLMWIMGSVGKDGGKNEK